MKAFNIGQSVRLKKNTILYPIFEDEVFKIAECRQTNGIWMYDLADDEGSLHLSAREDELELVLPDIINTGIAAGTAVSASSPDFTNFVNTAVDLAGVVPDFIGSTVSAAVQATGDTICAVGESVADVAGGCVEAASSAVDVLGDL